MGLFERSKAGEWAAIAMGCMCFADGAAHEPEIQAAKGQAATNPLFKRTIGGKKAERLFQETVDAIAQIPSAMLPSYEAKLGTLAGTIDDIHDKNFALATVIAVSMGDQTLSQGEYEMLGRFKEMLGATIPVPSPGAAAPAQYARPPVVPGEVEEPADEADERPAAAAEPAQPMEAAKAALKAVICASCGNSTQHYAGYGDWCASCQRYTTQPTPGDAPRAATPDVVKCPSCGQPTQLYPGYGNWCASCQRYATA